MCHLVQPESGVSHRTGTAIPLQWHAVTYNHVMLCVVVFTPVPEFSPKTHYWTGNCLENFLVHYRGESGGGIITEAKGVGALQASAHAKGQDTVASLTDFSLL